MIFGLEVGSNDCSFSVKRDFSAAGGGASSSSTAAAAGVAAPDEAAAGAAKEISGMLRRDCGMRKAVLVEVGGRWGRRARLGWKRRAAVVVLGELSKFHTFRLATRSAVSSRVN